MATQQCFLICQTDSTGCRSSAYFRRILLRKSGPISRYIVPMRLPGMFDATQESKRIGAGPTHDQVSGFEGRSIQWLLHKKPRNQSRDEKGLLRHAAPVWRVLTVSIQHVRAAGSGEQRYSINNKSTRPQQQIHLRYEEAPLELAEALSRLETQHIWKSK
ncbi:hypothetical protein OCU04_013103 [Sclerotinia nivalis]|uniref:Uncharacterized protein n=1 Tax=Sclerotinia nivalis TaxID=352851 RepID=A0A9X0A8R6_9HELO|nr:hypothetical protein OCU04_013103 [Sclerotinia nivalis]